MMKNLFFLIVQAAFVAAGQVLWHLDDAPVFSDAHRASTHFGAATVAAIPLLCWGMWRLFRHTMRD
jgi:hypothetical protein